MCDWRSGGFGLIGLLLAVMLAGVAPAGAEVVLVDAGVSVAPIVLFKDAPPRTRDAAVELASYIEKISGARPQIIDGQPDPLPKHAIWVGFQPAVRDLFPGVDFEFKQPEEILIAANDNHLVIAGRDRWDANHMEAKGRLVNITGRQQEYGTVNAVYTFIQERLNVRWIWPDEMGEDIVPSKRIAFAPFEFRYHPQIRARGCVLKYLSLGDTPEGPQQIWARRQRIQLDSLNFEGGHAFGTWWDRYHDQHPDYFALQPDGTRGGYPEPHTVKLCDSNPAVWDQWLANVEASLKADPTLCVFNASPNDSYYSGWCVCEKCRAWDDPRAPKLSYIWKGLHEDGPALTDRQLTFANMLARKLKERFPDKDLLVQLHAYGAARTLPLHTLPEKNVLISSVANFHLRGDSPDDDRSMYKQQFADWAKIANHVVWRPNLGNPAGFQWGLPDVAMTQAAEDFRFVADNHCIGLYFDMVFDHWATQGPHYYILAQLAWNPYVDAGAAMEDYYRRGFGPASEQIKAYWALLEQARTSFVKERKNVFRVFDIHLHYTPEFFARLESLLDEAQARLAGAAEVYRQRVAFVRAGLEYSRLVVDTRRWMQKLEQSKGKDADAKAKVLANWERALQMSKTLPKHAINWYATFQQPSNKRMMGLHPDNPLQGLILRKYLKGLE